MAKNPFKQKFQSPRFWLLIGGFIILTLLVIKIWAGDWDDFSQFLCDHWEIPVFFLIVGVLFLLLSPVETDPNKTSTGDTTQDNWRPEEFRQAQRARLSYIIIGGSLLLVIFAGGVAMFTIAGLGDEPSIYSDADVASALKDILFAVLPLAGTWVGTVLAFYFSTSSFEAAANQSRELYFASTDKIKGPSDRPIREIMTRRDAFEPLVAKEIEGKKLSEVVALMKDAQRVPVFQERETGKPPDKAIGVLHKGDLEKAQTAKDGSKIDPTYDQAKMPDELPLKTMVAASRILRPGAPLKEAEDILGETPTCRDFFITATGSRDGAVLGWVTNTALEKALGRTPESSV
ncbi:MAG: hypothetical protein AAGF94_17240 [Pseudomonadota bacterium]